MFFIRPAGDLAAKKIELFNTDFIRIADTLRIDDLMEVSPPEYAAVLVIDWHGPPGMADGRMTFLRCLCGRRTDLHEVGQNGMGNPNPNFLRIHPASSREQYAVAVVRFFPVNNRGIRRIRQE
ncbi:MAG: hypothetical protein M5U09_23825 [Gammaproteobacteria bacterium]|nr:hypothetical protein [Gammaproteobacteria bacterium]